MFIVCLSNYILTPFRKFDGMSNLSEADHCQQNSTGQKSPSQRRWINHGLTVLAIVIAWTFSTWLRMEWVSHAKSQPQMQWDKTLLPTTHDSYLFSSIIKQNRSNKPPAEPLKLQPKVVDFGALTIFGVALNRLLDIPAASTTTYMPVYAAGLLAIPMVLIGRLYGSILTGFCAACLAVAGSSYFNRTMAGYFDTDMFSVTIPALILCLLLQANKTESVRWLIGVSFLTFSYPFFYSSGTPIVTSLNLMFLAYRGVSWWIKRKDDCPKSISFSLSATLLLGTSTALCSHASGIAMATQTSAFTFSILLLVAACIYASYVKWDSALNKRLMLAGALAGLVCLCSFNETLKSIPRYAATYYPKIQNTHVYKWLYAEQQNADSSVDSAQVPLQYKNVIETIIEARSSDWSNLMERISGSSWGCILALIGYMLLLLVFPEFSIALPFIGIGVFAHWGGHRFTVHAVPIAALAVAMLPGTMIELYNRISPKKNDKPIKKRKSSNPAPSEPTTAAPWITRKVGVHIATVVLSIGILWPNVQLAKERSRALPTVLESSEVKLLDDIRGKSNPGDYVHTWWDWGSAVWFHAERNVLTSPNNQTHDTYVFAKMMTTDSPRLAAHLGRTAAEYFHHGGPEGRAGLAVEHLFQHTQLDPDEVLSDIEDHLPVEPTRDIFLFLPSKLLNFYHVLHSFSERNLRTGEQAPPAMLVRFQAAKLDGNALWISYYPQDQQPALLIDLAQLVVCEYAKRIAAKQMKAMTDYGQKIGWNSAIVTLQSTQGLLLHAKKLNLQPDAIEATLLDGRVTKIPYSKVSWVYPAMMLKGAERLDTRQRYKQNNPEGQTSGRHLIFSLNPPFAIITDDAVYNSQLMRLLVLDRPDKEYFELISSNPRGKVYKIKK